MTIATLGEEVKNPRRTIVAPLRGMVVEVLRRRGEWVQPGDAVVTDATGASPAAPAAASAQ